ncbi:MAG: DUF1326 domain-containing protein [Thermohalobaculum sp.]|nr:DUF1326 domain-containing protein [Thermohalobaculum sp.]
MLDTKTAIEPWSIRGELILNCNCTVFCPCVVSLGAHPPTQGSCKAWLGVRIDEGAWGATDLSGLNVAMMLDIPGSMSEGDWKAAGYFDDRADEAQFAALEMIFSGRARGTTGLFRLLVSEYLGSIREEVRFTTEGKVRHLTVGRRIQGAVAPVEGADPGQELKVTNTKYWMGPDVVIAQALKGKVRDFGRVWNLDGKSAEICQIDWTGP